MAIKERKQITGTTAQINAYEGHEGQIVWDKEKNTLVGMSGTAGKNYPLAPKEYVDNEVAKCLPLTGGVMLGAIQSDPNNPELFIGHDYNKRLGACFALRSVNRDDSDLKGTFALAARTPEQETWLTGKPDGDLQWGSERLLSISAYDSGWLRYSDGLQICWGKAEIPANHVNAAVNLPVPFSNADYSLVADYLDADNIPCVSVGAGNKTTTSFALAAASPDYSWARYLNWVTIGRWK